MRMTRAATKERCSRSPGRRTAASAKPAKPNRKSTATPKSTGERKSIGGDRWIGQDGQRLAPALDSVSALPALAESRRRLLGAASGGTSSGEEVATAIES